ncbi:unnamed protein product [Arctia plantaginis]|uniref:FP protein C-terminal domain-containing protein n=1 Tax=Arctia plantaginis TaxID=874455 RepID=A0A8S1BD58_ARCPL|nr:unnamed protein product [Arctia plantaginis]
MNYKCGACAELLTDGVHCTVCKQQLHFQCAGITEAGYRKLGDRKLTWRCGKCKQTTPTQPLSPRIEPESLIMRELRAINDKLAPLECLKDEVVALRNEFEELKGSFNDTNKELREFSARFTDIEHRLLQVEKAQKQVDSIQNRLDKLEDETNAGEQWARMNNIEIKGVPQVSNENLFEILSSLGSQISYPVNKTQINFLTRVPTREKDRAKPIIVCFCNRYVKEDFLAAARSTMKSRPLTLGRVGLSGGHKIYVNDHLTTQNKFLLSKTKKAAAERGFRYVWVKHAKIHARKNDTSPVIVVKSELDLAKIM